MKKIILSVICVILGAVFVIDSAGVSAAVVKSIRLCFNTVIPSLFAFLALSSFLTASGLYRILFKPLYFILKPLLRLSEEEFAVFMLSMAGGYPVGVKLLTDMVKLNPSYKRRAEHMMMYCYCASPVFIIAITGAGLYIWLSNMLACFIFAVIANIKNKAETNSRTPKYDISSDLLINSVLSAGSALYRICLVIVLFGVIIRTAEFSGLMQLSGEYEGAVRAFIEITNCVNLEGNYAVTAALTSLGGLCVLFQTAAISGGKMSQARFLAARIPIALLSGAICWGMTRGMAVNAVTPTQRIEFFAGGSPVSSVCLMIMTLLLLGAVKSTKSQAED